jgi:uncharacterized repeat protein (TIGR02543 family)
VFRRQIPQERNITPRRLLSGAIVLSLFTSLAIASTPASATNFNEVVYTGTNSGLVGDDNATSAIPLGFNFSFFGSAHSQAHININGTLNFGAAFAGYSNGPLSSSNTDGVYAFWDDLNTNVTTNPIRYSTIGTSPNRKFVTQWTNIYFHGTSVQMGTFQVILYETSNVVQIQFRDIIGVGRAEGDSATIGIKGGSQVNQFKANSLEPRISSGTVITYTPITASNTTSYAQSSGDYDPVFLSVPGSPESPVLANPADGSLGVTTSPILEWNPSLNATSYKIYLSTNSSFSPMIAGYPKAPTPSNATSIELSGLAENTQYFWRIGAVNSTAELTSTTRTFTTGSSNTPPNSAASISGTLQGGASVPVNSPESGVLNFLLSDPDATQQVRFRVQISGSATFSPLLIDYRGAVSDQGAQSYSIGATSGTYLVGSASTPIPIGTYYLRIRAEDSASASSDWTTLGTPSFSVVSTIPLTVTGLTGEKDWDGTTAVSLTGTASLTGIEEGDDVSLSGTPSGVFTSSDAGNREITVTGLSIVGADSSKYSLSTTIQGEIRRVSQQISWLAPSSLDLSESGVLLPAASSDRSQAIAYSIAESGSASCSLNERTLTFSSVGSCQITAEAPLTTNFFASSVTKTITITHSYRVDLNYQGATGGNTSQFLTFDVDGEALELPVPTRVGFVFEGWFSQPSGGQKVSDGGPGYSPQSSQTIYARWIQASLWGIGDAQKIGTINVLEDTSASFGASHSGSSFSLEYPENALPSGTVLDLYVPSSSNRAQALIAEANSYIVNVVVAWLTQDNEVPDTALGTAIRLIIDNPSIKAGARIYSIVGAQVIDLGFAQIDGRAEVFITSDPEIVIASVRPEPPRNVTARRAGGAISVSWTSPISNGGSEVTSYQVTSSSGDQCETSTLSCTFSNLTVGESYSFSVVAVNAIGASVASPSTVAISLSSPAAQSPSEALRQPPALPGPSSATGAALVGGVPQEVLTETDQGPGGVISGVSLTGPGWSIQIKSPRSDGSQTTGKPTESLLAVTQGASMDFKTIGMRPNSEVEIWLFSEPVLVGAYQTNSRGALSEKIPIPSSVKQGRHTLAIRSSAADGAELVATIRVKMLAAKKVKHVLAFSTSSSILEIKERSSLLKTLDALPARKQGHRVTIVNYISRAGNQDTSRSVLRKRIEVVRKLIRSEINAKSITQVTRDLPSSSKRLERIKVLITR